MSPKIRRITLFTIRIILGLLFLLSGIGKLIDPNNARYLVELMATEFYWLIEYATPIVYATSVLEIVLAILLLRGRWLRSVLAVSALMVFFFTLVLSYFWIQGQSIENCGCFGALGIGGGIEVSLLRNLVLLVLIAGGFVSREAGERRKGDRTRVESRLEEG